MNIYTLTWKEYKQVLFLLQLITLYTKLIAQMFIEKYRKNKTFIILKLQARDFVL